jgi:CBS domain-containing protein
MIAKDLIDFDIPFLNKKDEVSKALELMEEFECTRLPVVVAEGYYAGFLEKKMIITCDGEKISDFRLLGENGEINQDSHYYGIIKCALEFDLPLISIKDDHGLYLGVVPTVSAFKMFASCSALLTPGGIIVLSLNQKDYSVSEIGRIIENSDARIINSQTSIDPKNNEKIWLTLKLNKEDISHLIPILKLSGYQIEKYFSTHVNHENTKERYDSLMNYLKI